MPTATENAIIAAVLQSIVIALPLWIAVMRYVSGIGPEPGENEIKAVSSVEPDRRIDQWKNYDRYRRAVRFYVFFAILSVLAAGLALLSYLTQTGVISGPLPAIPLESPLGWSVYIMVVLTPFLFIVILLSAEVAKRTKPDQSP